jgi:hypothetical protein
LSPEDLRRLDQIVEATNDHELQSELWIFLHDYPNISIERATTVISQKTSAEQIVYKATSSLMRMPPQTHTLEFLQSLESTERSVATMMMLGVPQETAREYKSLSYIRYIQTISAIVASKAWEIYLEKEIEYRGKRRTRSSANQQS